MMPGGYTNPGGGPYGEGLEAKLPTDGDGLAKLGL